MAANPSAEIWRPARAAFITSVRLLLSIVSAFVRVSLFGCLSGILLPATKNFYSAL
jgi:hypothetical protein